MGPRSLARRVSGSLPGRGRTPDSQWFWDHFDTAPAEIVGFCELAGVHLADREIADIGCGDGIMASGLARRVKARRLVGFDIVPTDVGKLLERMESEGVGDALPPGVEFQESTPSKTPAADDSFDFVYSWSAFEHIADPISVLTEIRRILRPAGRFFLQLWPFYLSAKGSHLWDWFPEDFHHLRTTDQEILAELRRSGRHAGDWTEYMAREFEHLNRVTLSQLQRSILAAGFDIDRLELLTAPVQLTPDLARYPWADLAVSGVKLIALPRP